MTIEEAKGIYLVFDTQEDAQESQDAYFDKWIVEQRKKVPNDNAERWALVEEIEIDGVIKYGYTIPPKET